MAHTLSQLEAIEQALAAGLLRATFTGPDGATRTTEWATPADLRKTRDELRAELGISKPSAARGKAWRPICGNGL